MLMILGLILFGVGNLWLIIRAFMTSILWGLGCLFIPFVSVVYVILNWDDSKAPFVMYVLGMILMFFGAGSAA